MAPTPRATAESQDELNRLNRRGHAGFTIALAPLGFGLIGHWLDGVTGWGPWLAISFAVYALVGAIVHTMIGYRREMAAEDRTPEWTRGAGSAAGAESGSRPKVAS